MNHINVNTQEAHDLEGEDVKCYSSMEMSRVISPKMLKKIEYRYSTWKNTQSRTASTHICTSCSQQHIHNIEEAETTQVSINGEKKQMFYKHTMENYSSLRGRNF